MSLRGRYYTRFRDDNKSYRIRSLRLYRMAITGPAIQLSSASLYQNRRDAVPFKLPPDAAPVFGVKKKSQKFRIFLQPRDVTRRVTTSEQSSTSNEHENITDRRNVRLRANEISISPRTKKSVVPQRDLRTDPNKGWVVQALGIR